MPREHTPIHFGIYELGRSDDPYTLNAGLTWESPVLDIRDIASAGVQDFQPPDWPALPGAIGHSQVWYLCYALLVEEELQQAIAHEQGFYCWVDFMFRGSISNRAWPGTYVWLPAYSAKYTQGQFRIESDGAQFHITNQTGVDLTIRFSVWAKVF